MEITLAHFILASIVTGYACLYYYKQGMKEGAERCIRVLHEQKVIAYDSTGEIYPNPFFKKK
jgi:hypothetical protein